MRVLVTGASGTGTTTLGRALSAELKVAFFDVDDYFWLPTEPPYQHKREPGARLSLFAGDLAKAPHSVTSGSVIGWGREVEEGFSLIVFLTLQPELRAARLLEREVARFGRADPEFLEWAAQYDEGSLDVNSRMGDEKWIAERSCPVVRIEGDSPVRERVARVIRYAEGAELRARPSVDEAGGLFVPPSART